MRYDPASGKKFKVTADDPRYMEWSNRKPSKRSKLQEKIISAPGEYIKERATKAAESTARNVATSVARKAVPVIAAAAAESRLVGALPLLGVAGALAAAGILGGWLMDKATDSTGDKINRISLAFVAAQRELMRRTGVSTWQQVPEQPRNKLLAEYKAALAHVAANPGLARFEKTPTFRG